MNWIALSAAACLVAALVLFVCAVRSAANQTSVSAFPLWGMGGAVVLGMTSLALALVRWLL